MARFWLEIELCIALEAVRHNLTMSVHVDPPAGSPLNFVCSVLAGSCDANLKPSIVPSTFSILACRHSRDQQSGSLSWNVIVCIRCAGQYPLTLKFTEDYPTKPPACSLPAGFFHPNVFDSGAICLSILKEGAAWKPSISVKQVQAPVSVTLIRDLRYRVHNLISFLTHLAPLRPD